MITTPVRLLQNKFYAQKYPYQTYGSNGIAIFWQKYLQEPEFLILGSDKQRNTLFENEL